MYALKNALKIFAPLIPALATFIYFANKLFFVQDDAYITYRYVQNFLNGHGLVYNIGERVEGFTNFGWTILLIFVRNLGFNYMLGSQIVGLSFGCATIVVIYLISRRIFGERDWFALIPPYILGATLSFSYWSIAGLETASFVFLVTLSIYLYLKRSWSLIATLTLAVWVRPEGAFLTGLLILIELIQYRRLPRYSLICAGIAFVASLPFVAFKLFYYHSILPNPFYAKTGFNMEQLTSGLEYAGRFFGHYWLLAAGMVIGLVLLLMKRLNRDARTVWLITLFYTLYIILVGGDVLKVHRFFLPVVGLMAIAVALGLRQLVARLDFRNRTLIAVVLLVPLMYVTHIFPSDFAYRYNLLEKSFMAKMQTQARQLKSSDTSNFSVAVATIGIFGYELLGHKIIDLVGLTDSTIARHPEPPIEGMSTTWKERAHNSKYFLTVAPDYLLYSTGIKPSAPAERALLLYPEFMDSYRALGWKSPRNPRLTLYVFKKVREPKGPMEPTYPVEYVQDYKEGIDRYVKGKYKEAIAYFDKAIAESPQPYYVYLLYMKTVCLQRLGKHRETYTMLNDLLKRDSLIFEAHRDLFIYKMLFNDTAEAAIHDRWCMKLIPWDWPEERKIQLQRVRENQRQWEEQQAQQQNQ